MVEPFIMAGERFSFSPPCPAGSALSFARTFHFPVTSVVWVPVQGCFSMLQSAVAYSTSSSTPLTLTHTKLRLRYCRSPGDKDKDMSFATSTIPAAYSETTLFSLFRQIGFNEKDTETLLLTNPALRFTPYESIHTRLQSLQDLGVKGVALSRLVSKRPHVLTAEEVDAFVCFLQNDDLNLRGKLEARQIERLLYSTEPRFLLGFEGKVRLLLRHGIPKEKLPLVLNKANLTKALCQKSAQEIERMFAFLNRFGGVDLILRRPETLNYDLDRQLIPRIGFLLDLSGGDEVATATLLRKIPFVVAYSIGHMSDQVEFLKSFAGLSDPEIFRIAVIYLNLFSISRKRKLHPRIDFLKKCGLNSHDICKFLTRSPWFFSQSFENNHAHKLVFLFKLGYKDKTKELAMTMGVVTRTTCRNMQEAIGIFLENGLSYENILKMSMKHPQVLQYNHESLKEKLNYLVEDMGREVGELLSFPAFLGYKLDSRIKHRYEAKKNIIGEGLSINKLLSVSTERFSKKSYKTTAEMASSVHVGDD